MKESPARRPPSLGSLLAAAHAVEARVEAALTETGLSLAKLGVLKTLANSDKPVSLGELADQNRCVRSNITQLVDRLEAEGLVRRVDDPEDRRVRRAELTAEGKRAARKGLEILDGEEAAAARALGREGLAGLVAALERLSG